MVVAGEDRTGSVGPIGDDVVRRAYLAAVVDLSSDAILSKDLNGTITSWNASAERIFGYSPSEMIGQSIRRLIPDELQAEEDEILARLRAGKYFDHYETVRLTKDGRRLNVSLSISPIKNEVGEIVGAAKIIRDVTARKLAEQQLVATTAKFESVFNQSGIFAGILDTEGNLREVNDLALEASGYTKEEVIDRPFWETSWWRGSEEVQDRIRLASAGAAEGEVFRETLPYWIADGTERVVDFAIHPIRDEHGVVRFLHPTGIDITDRIRAEEALRAREAEEREIAIGLQRALLPARLVVPARISCAARYEAGSDVLEVGGDWYDAFTLSDGRVAFTVGDVVGHGLGAAAAMGQLRTALAALAESAASPGDLLARLDGFLARTKTTDFATVVYAVLDPATGVCEYASAGHLPILLVEPGGEVRWLAEGRSPPLSGEHPPARSHATVSLEPESLLVLYSDGLVERRGELLSDSLKRLEAVGKTLVGVPVRDVCDKIVAALGVETSREDDVAVLALRLDAVSVRSFSRVFPARPEELRALRVSMREWMSERRIPAEAQKALLLAVGEACANAIEHAYHDRPAGEVSIDIEENAEQSFEVAVRDFGRFRTTAETRHENRGRGTDLMRALATDFRRDLTPTGTTVRFRIAVEGSS